MPIILILLSLFMFSCGKENKIDLNKAPINFDQKSFAVINHEEGKSLLRNKMLNTIVEEKFPVQSSKHQITNRDELDNFPLSERELKNYEEKEKWMAKVIVSYPTRLEIYFLPEGIPLSSLPKVLNLPNEDNRKFKLIVKDAIKTYKGGIFYLVNLNHSDLMKNDVAFYQETLLLGNDFKERLVDTDNRKIELKVRYNFYSMSLVTQAAKQGGGHCSKGDRDTDNQGLCGPCTYNINVESGEYIMAQANTLEDLGLKVALNNELINDSALTISRTDVREFTVTLPYKEEGQMQLIQGDSKVFQETSSGFNYSTTCTNRNVQRAVSLPSKAEVSVKVKFFGRGDELKKIVF